MHLGFIQQLNECDAVVIPIDATALMQKNTGMVNYTEIGTWHEEKNNSELITQLLKNAYTNVQSPRLVILAPVKCETYTRTARDADNLLSHVKIGYSKLIDFFKSDSLINKVTVVITPVQTIGNVVYAYHKTDKDDFTQFEYYKTPINAPYDPKYGEQPLRYILLFLMNVFLEKKKAILQQQKQELENLENQLSEEKDKLEIVRREFQENQILLNKRNQMWWLFRDVMNIFDDRESPYYTAKGEFEKKKSDVKDTQFNFELTSDKIQATQAEISTFNNALYRFAKDYKNNEGFAIIQGYKLLEVPELNF